MESTDTLKIIIFTVENSQWGYQSSKLKDAEITPKVVKVGETLSFKLDAEDDLAGVKSISISFKNPSGTRTEHVPLRFDTNAKKWMGAYKVLSTDEGGKYKEFFISLSDNAGNRTYGWNLANDFEGKIIFNIDNDKGDVIPPELKNISTNAHNKN
jgi:hypothetical protein